ncbi:MAG: FHA domain-containing protein [Pseudanabaena sp.]
MITCPSCAHSNPDGAVNCEACFTPLPIVKNIQCPSCHSTMLSEAKFCGHCGFNLSDSMSLPPELPIANSMSNSLPNEITEDNTMGTSSLENLSSEVANVHNVAENNLAENNLPEIQELQEVSAYPEPISNPSPQSEPDNVTSNSPANKPANASTQLQQFAASLLHIQTNLNIEIPAHLPVVHIGKPNMVIPPDIDVSGFPDSDIVSRIHADIRAEGGSFYFEDTGSSNGTYINNLPLPAGNRHKLRAGDRISLGKGDKVSFVFQVIE